MRRRELIHVIRLAVRSLPPVKWRAIPRRFSLFVNLPAFMRFRIRSSRRPSRSATRLRHRLRCGLRRRIRRRRSRRDRLPPAASRHKNRRAAKQRRQRQREPSPTESAIRSNCRNFCRDLDHHDRTALMTADFAAAVDFLSMADSAPQADCAATYAPLTSAQIDPASLTHRAKTKPSASPSPAPAPHPHNAAAVPSQRQFDAQSLQNYPYKKPIFSQFQKRAKNLPQ